MAENDTRRGECRKSIFSDMLIFLNLSEDLIQVVHSQLTKCYQIKNLGKFNEQRHALFSNGLHLVTKFGFFLIFRMSGSTEIPSISFASLSLGNRFLTY